MRWELSTMPTSRVRLLSPVLYYVLLLRAGNDQTAGQLLSRVRLGSLGRKTAPVKCRRTEEWGRCGRCVPQKKKSSCLRP